MEEEKKGRIEYIEPNNLSGAGINGIPFPYEDYTIYVDLEVHTNNRDSCGIINEETKRFSTEDGTLRLFDGTKGVLTTNYTDATYSGNIDNNTSECVGVESINITYDKNFIPQVDIKFIDVRGLSFFTSQETSEVAKLRDGQVHNIGSSILKQIFVLPPADFYLRVKGFYGKSIKFKLIVDNIKVAFNDSTGNFEIDVKLIGKMFGVYVDMPLSFISIAPFLEYSGKDYWNSKQSTTFRYDDGITPIMKFIDIKEKLSAFNSNMGKETPEDARNNESTTVETATLNDIFDSYDNFNRQLIDFFGSDFTNVDMEKIQSDSSDFLFNRMLIGQVRIENDDKTEFKMWVNRPRTIKDEKTKEKPKITIGESDSEISKPSNDLLIMEELAAHDLTERKKKDVIDSAEDCFNKIRSFNTSSKIGIEYPDIFPSSVEEFHDKDSDPIFGHMKKVSVVTTIYDNGQINTTYNGVQTIFNIHSSDAKKEVDKFIKEKIEENNGHKKGTYFFEMYLFSDGNYKEKIEITSKKIKSENLKNNGVSEEYLKDIIGILGFKPTIQNVFFTIFAHMETFIQSFYRMLLNIKKNEAERTVENLGLSTSITDMSRNSGFVPPFTAIYKSNKITDESTGTLAIKDEYVRPGDVFGTKNKRFNADNFEEMKFVDAIYNATKSYSERLADIDKINEDVNGMSIEPDNTYIPTNLFDILYTGKRENPYTSLFQELGKKDAFEEAIDALFILRYFNSTLGYPEKFLGEYDTFQGPKDRAQAFGYLEALNFAKAFKGTKEDIEPYIKEENDQTYANRFKRIFDSMVTSESGHIWNVPNSGKVFTPGNEMKWFTVKINDNEENTYFPVSLYGFNDLAREASSGTFLQNERGYWVCLNKPELPNNTFHMTENDLYMNEYKDVVEDPMVGFHEPGTVPSALAKDFLSVFNFFPRKRKNGRRLYRFDGVFSYEFSGDTAIDSAINPIKTYFVDGISEFDHKNAIYRREWKTSPDSYKFPAIAQVWDDTMEEKKFFAPTIFDHKIYKDLAKNKETIKGASLKSKAYLFLFSIPLDYDSKERSFGKERNRTLCSVLQEGAFYWRYNYMKNNSNHDPIIYEGSDYKSPGKDELLKIDGHESSLCILKKGSGKKYLKGPYIGEGSKITQQRIREMEELFVSWSTSGEFIELLSCLENTDYTKNKNYIINPKKEISNSENVDTYRNVIRYYNKESKCGFYVSLAYAHRFQYFIHPKSYVHSIIAKLIYSYYTVIDFSEINVRPVKAVDLIESYRVFRKTIKAYFKIKKFENRDNEITKEEVEKSKSVEKDIKLSIYLTLKRLYDFHFCGEKKERWIMKKIDRNGKWIFEPSESDFNNFIFIDQFYNNIGSLVLSNIENVGSRLTGKTMNSLEESEEGNKGLSVYSFMGDTLADVGMSMQSFPLGNAMISDYSIRDMFRPNSMFEETDNSNNFFMCIHRSEPSANLDIPGCGFKNDSFDIADSLGNINDSLPEALRTENGYRVPSFGVSFGKQNQSYFKSVKVNMDNFKETEYSIEAEMNVASRGSRGPREGKIFGQDVYSTFSNYSYTCSVESMGNMQIMPGMLFQLNNIPMFKGTYMIMSVSHKISPGDITTNFVGVRIKRTSLPFVENPLLFIENAGQIDMEFNYGVGEYNGKELNSKSGDEITDQNINLCGAVYKVEDEVLGSVENKGFRPKYNYKEGERRAGFADVNDIMDYIISVEGEYSDNPNDSGGPTMYGVTIMAYKEYKKRDVTIEELQAITEEEWADIFKKNYWDSIFGDRIRNQSIANILVDLAYNSGAGSVLPLLKKAFPEFEMYDKLSNAINALNNIPDQKEAFYKIKKARGQRYIDICCANPKNNVFIKGWFNRLKHFMYSASAPCAPRAK